MKLVSAALVATLAAAPVAAADATAGEKVFRKCMACHAVGDGAKNKVGPQLNGIVGAKAGAVEGFKYSKALLEKAEEGLIWDAESLALFLEKPKGFIPKTRMSFPGLKKEEDRADVIAYLEQFQ